MSAFARQCERCKRVVAPRGEESPRFCPVCGSALSGGPVELAYAGVDLPALSRYAIASVVLGVFGLMFPCAGALLGLLAIGTGLSARDQIQVSAGRLRGSWLASTGVALGVLAMVIWGGVCVALG